MISLQSNVIDDWYIVCDIICISSMWEQNEYCVCYQMNDVDWAHWKNELNWIELKRESIDCDQLMRNVICDQQHVCRSDIVEFEKITILFHRNNKLSL
jgi:hypothetical protein